MEDQATNAAPYAPMRDSRRDGTALLIIDMISDFEFEDGAALRRAAERTIAPIEMLREEAEGCGCPVIYVNDNFGEWHSERSRLVERAVAKGGEVPRRLAPRRNDYFIIKPQFSGFYSTNLPVLLPKLGVSRLVLAGVATDICILFTAADAHMRDYALWIPEDVVASAHDARGRWALEIMRGTMGAETASTAALSLAGWSARLDPRPAECG